MKNLFLTDDQSQKCNQLVYIFEPIANEKQLSRKNLNSYIEKAFKQKVNPQNKRKTCKFCNSKITNKRNKTYCSNVCRQQGSRKIGDLSLKKLVKNYEWRRVERFIKSSPLGLNSINHESNLHDLLQLFILCHFERKIYNNCFKLRHIIPVRLGGMNTIINFIIAPCFIKTSINLHLINSLNLLDAVEPLYVPDSIIDTCLKNRKLKNSIKNLINKIDIFLELDNKSYLFSENSITAQNDKFETIESLFSPHPDEDNSINLLNHLKIQMPVIKHYNLFEPVHEIIEICTTLSEYPDSAEEDKNNLFNLIALFCYIIVLNFSHQKLDFINEIHRDIKFINSKDTFDINKLTEINIKLIDNIAPYIKFNLVDGSNDSNKPGYFFIKKLYGKYKKQ